MVNVSRKYLESAVKKEAWQKLREEVNKNKSIEETLRRFFTPSEIVMIEKRLAILVMLGQGKSYLAIRRLLDVSPGTVSFIKQGFKRYKRELKSSRKFITPEAAPRRVRRKFPRYKGSSGFGLSEW